MNKKYVGVLVIVVVFSALFIPKILQRLGRGEVVDRDRHQVGVEKTGEDELLVIGNAPRFEFVSHQGDTISSEYYNGKVYVVEFFFTTCPTICPIMNRNMLKLQEKFKSRDDFGVASITIDPAHDTPEVLNDYAKSYGITHEHWKLLHGSLEDVMALSNKGFNLYAGVNASAEGGFEHSGMFALIDQQGRIRSRTDNFGNPLVYYDGTSDEGLAQIAKDITTLLKN